MFVEPPYPHTIARRGNPNGVESPDQSEEIAVYAGSMRHVVLRQRNRIGEFDYVIVHPEDVERLIDYLIEVVEESKKVVLRGEGPQVTVPQKRRRGAKRQRSEN